MGRLGRVVAAARVAVALALLVVVGLLGLLSLWLWYTHSISFYDAIRVAGLAVALAGVAAAIAIWPPPLVMLVYAAFGVIAFMYPFRQLPDPLQVYQSLGAVMLEVLERFYWGVSGAAAAVAALVAAAGAAVVYSSRGRGGWRWSTAWILWVILSFAAGAAASLLSSLLYATPASIAACLAPLAAGTVGLAVVLCSRPRGYVESPALVSSAAALAVYSSLLQTGSASLDLLPLLVCAAAVAVAATYRLVVGPSRGEAFYALTAALVSLLTVPLRVAPLTVEAESLVRAAAVVLAEGLVVYAVASLVDVAVYMLAPRFRRVAAAAAAIAAGYAATQLERLGGFKLAYAMGFTAGLLLLAGLLSYTVERPEERVAAIRLVAAGARELAAYTVIAVALGVAAVSLPLLSHYTYTTIYTTVFPGAYSLYGSVVVSASGYGSVGNTSFCYHLWTWAAGAPLAAKYSVNTTLCINIYEPVGLVAARGVEVEHGGLLFYAIRPSMYCFERAYSLLFRRYLGLAAPSRIELGYCAIHYSVVVGQSLYRLMLASGLATSLPLAAGGIAYAEIVRSEAFASTGGGRGREE